jgi:hypothetical protein
MASACASCRECQWAVTQAQFTCPTFWLTCTLVHGRREPCLDPVCISEAWLAAAGQCAALYHIKCSQFTSRNIIYLPRVAAALLSRPSLNA